METKKMITIKLENNNNVKMNNKQFKTFVKNTVDEIGMFDSIYYLNECDINNNFWFDALSEELGMIDDYELDSYEVMNKEEIKKELQKIIHW